MSRQDALRIVHCFRSPIGGIFRHVRDLALAQIAAGHSVGIICDASTGGAREEELFREIGPRLPLGLHRVAMERSISPTDIIALLRVFRSIRGLNPDIIHTHGAKGGAYGRMIGTLLRVSGNRVARIYCPHGGSLHYDPRTRSGRIFFGLERQMERLSDAFVFVSRYEADAYAAKVGRPTKPFVIAPNGLRDEEFELVELARDASEFLYIGMMRDLKGPDLFIEALAQLRDRRGTAPTAEIVGDGPDKERYRALVERLGLAPTTHFHDAMPPRAAFARASTVVVPSRAESMPYVVLETIAAGRPLVATSVGGIPEIFGAAAHRLVRPGDASALAIAMERVSADLEHARAEALALREDIRPRFSVEAMASRVAAIYAKSRAA